MDLARSGQRAGGDSGKGLAHLVLPEQRPSRGRKQKGANGPASCEKGRVARKDHPAICAWGNALRSSYARIYWVRLKGSLHRNRYKTVPVRLSAPWAGLP